jgi:hypothetical protein
LPPNERRIACHNRDVEPVSLVARALVDLGRAWSQRRRHVRVRTHYAFPEGSIEPLLMNNVVKLGTRPIAVTHVWLALEPERHVANPHRPLPRMLDPDEPWETWVVLSALDSQVSLAPSALLRSARVRLSTGRTVKARANRNVPGFGAVPGGSAGGK